MSYNSQTLLTDAQGNPIPQYYNPVLDRYEPAQGANGSLSFQLPDGGNAEGTLLANEARTTTTNAPVQTNANHRGVILTLNVLGNPGSSETLTLLLQFRDPVTGSLDFPLAELITLPAVSGIYRLIIYPVTSNAIDNPDYNVSYALPLPLQWSAQVKHSGTGSWIYSLGYSLIV